MRISGWPTIPVTPHAPMAVNHRIITGPKNRPTAAVPWRCTANSTTMITAVIGTIQGSRSGWTVLTPSTAESTEMAGVITESPKNRAAPKRPNAASIMEVRPPRGVFHRRSIVISAMMPPSPSLSARITNVM